MNQKNDDPLGGFEMVGNLEFVRRTEEAWQDIEAGNGKLYSAKEFVKHLENECSAFL